MVHDLTVNPVKTEVPIGKRVAELKPGEAVHARCTDVDHQQRAIENATRAAMRAGFAIELDVGKIEGKFFVSVVRKT
jgi:hypothetical protein